MNSMNWLIIEDKPEKAAYLIHNIFKSCGSGAKIKWLYVNHSEPARGILAQKESPQRDWDTLQYPIQAEFFFEDTEADIEFYWCKERESFHSFFQHATTQGLQAEIEEQIILLDIHLPPLGRFDTISDTLKNAIQDLLQLADRKVLIPLITTVYNPAIVRDKLKLYEHERRILLGDWNLDAEYLEDNAPLVIQQSLANWTKIYQHCITIQDFFEACQKHTISDFHTIWEEGTEELPLRLQLLIQLLGFTPDDFLELIPIKPKNHARHPIMECMKTMATADSTQFSPLAVLLISWKIHLDIFGYEHPNNKSFAKCINTLSEYEERENIVRSASILVPQSSSTRLASILKYQKMFALLLPNEQNSMQSNLESIFIDVEQLVFTFTNIDLKGLFGKLKINFEYFFFGEESNIGGMTSQAILQFHIQRFYKDFPIGKGLELSTPEFRFSVVQSEDDEKLQLKFTSRYET